MDPFFNYFFRCFRGYFLDLNPAFSGDHENKFLGFTVQHNTGVKFLGDINTSLNEQALHFLAFWSGLVGDQVHAQHLGRQCFHFIATVSQFHTAALAAAAGMDLCFHYHRF